MASFNRHQFAPYVLAAALQAACAAWPCAVFAQSAPSGTSGTSTSGSSATANDPSSQGDTLGNAVQRQQLDEQRLLGGPGTSDNPYSVTPYSSNGASPDDAQDALTNEKHMHVVTPGDYAASEANASGGRGSASRSGGTSSRIGSNGRSRAGNAVARGSAGISSGGHRSSAGYDYGASQTSPTAQVYGNPYSSPYGSPDQSSSELYKSPW
ncbi:hypothetical protein [Paraburkholderia acidiphila]|uniref:Uncharacterized protein n=1 Tax=Paraburkholderia acidiphila TaxID=2571747 RepID=A0A7Z2G326_9BURK|nr:hypothetical protein [Paraburkholderia acidiphila]QGZ53854.1 hypothetical protein FAZ97_02410 [Paraburkholderia acidiphila]